MKPGLLSRFSAGIGAAHTAFRQGAAVAKSAFAAAFIRGTDLDGIAGGGKLLEPYAQSAWVHRAVKLKVDEIAAVPLEFYDGDNEYQDKAFLDWWENPFITASGQPMNIQAVREQLASWPDLAGEFFIVLGDDWLNPFASRSWKSLSRPIIARPDRMRHIVQGGKIIGWMFTDAGGRQHPLVPEQVIHSPLWNPYDDFRGLATVKVVFNAAEADYLAGLYVRNLMRNNGDQGVYVIGKNGMPEDGQKEQIIAALREKRARALRGDFSAAFLTGDITIEDPKAEAPGADMNAGRILNRHEIYTGLGVPPSMADVKASYSIGADSDRFTLITGSCQPLSKKVDAALSRIASIMTGKPIRACADWDDHPVMQQVRRERVDTALKLWGVGMPMEEANSYLDLGMNPFAGWDQGYLPFSVAPIAAGAPDTNDGSAANTPALDPAEDPSFEEDDSIKSLRLLVLARARSQKMACRAVAAEDSRIDREFAQFACACHGVAGIAQKADRPAKEIAQWRTLMSQRRTTVKSFQSALGRVLMKARVETLKRLEKYQPATDKALIEQKAGAAAELLFNLAEFVTSFNGAMENQQKTALKTSGEQLFKEIGLDDPYHYPPAKVLEFLQARKNKLKDVPQDVYDRVKAQLEEGIKAGDTQADLEKRVKTVFNEISDGQAQTIALTETSAAYGAGRNDAMKQAGIQYKQWLTSGNSNVRAAHAEANGQTVAIDEPFIVDGEELMYPGDDDGSAGNVINCHCVSISVAELPQS